MPQRAVLEGPQGKFVYIVNAEDKTETRPVQLGDWEGEDWIITAGLSPGDKVVVDGVMKIGPATLVRVAQPKPSKAGAPGAAVNNTPAAKDAAQ